MNLFYMMTYNIREGIGETETKIKTKKWPNVTIPVQAKGKYYQKSEKLLLVIRVESKSLGIY